MAALPRLTQPLLCKSPACRGSRFAQRPAALRVTPPRAAEREAQTLSAAGAVSAADAAFKAGRHGEAVQLLTQELGEAHTMPSPCTAHPLRLPAAASPSDDESRAALYNRACALTALGRFEEAGEDLRAACALLSARVSPHAHSLPPAG